MSKNLVLSLQELADKQKFDLRYELLPLQKIEAKRHIFLYKLTAGNVKVYGKGYSKQEAKHKAASKALEQLTNFDNIAAIQSQDFDANQDDELNIVGLLNKFVLDNNLPRPNFELLSAVGEPHAQLFTIECKVGTVSLQGTDTTKKKAKFSAAKQMLELLSEMKFDDITEIISFHDANFCNHPSNQEEVRNIYNENAFICKKRKSSRSNLVSSYSERIKFMMKENDLYFDEIWPCYEPVDLNQLKSVLQKLNIRISVKFMQGRNNTEMAFITLDTEPEFALVEWASTKKEALDSAIKQTIDFLKIMTQ